MVVVTQYKPQLVAKLDHKGEDVRVRLEALRFTVKAATDSGFYLIDIPVGWLVANDAKGVSIIRDTTVAKSDKEKEEPVVVRTEHQIYKHPRRPALTQISPIRT